MNAPDSDSPLSSVQRVAGRLDQLLADADAVRGNSRRVATPVLQRFEKRCET
jgi:hypothetical protein